MKFKNQPKKQSLRFNIIMRITDPHSEVMDYNKIANKIASIITKKDDNDDGLVAIDLESMNVINDYIDVKIKRYHEIFRKQFILQDGAIESEASDYKYHPGSLILFFNLVVTTIVDVYYVYRFVNGLIDYLSDDRSLNGNGALNTTITYVPFDDNGALSTIENTPRNNHNRLLVISSLALAIALLALFSAIYGYFNSIDENKARDVIKEEMEQVIDNRIEDKLNRAKLDYVFDRMTSAPQNAPTEETETKQSQKRQE